MRHALLLLTIGAVATAPVEAYELLKKSGYGGFSTCSGPVPLYDFSDPRTFQVRRSDFSVEEILAIQRGMAAWSDTNPDNFGWDLAIIDGGTDETPEYRNGENNIFKTSFSDATELLSLGFDVPSPATAIGFMKYDFDRLAPDCASFTLLESNVYFNADVVWADKAEWLQVPGPRANDLGQVAAHEFGHHLGLDHEDDSLTVMSSLDPSIGRPADQSCLIGQNHAKFMRNAFPDQTSGTNVALTKRFMVPDDSGVNPYESKEWFPSGFLTIKAGALLRPFRTRFGETSRHEGQSSIFGGATLAHHMSEASVSVRVRTWLIHAPLLDDSYQFGCEPPGLQAGNRWLVREEVVTLGGDFARLVFGPMQMPFLPDPTDLGTFGTDGTYYPPLDPTGGTTSGREYRLCVHLDADDDLIETNELDNFAISDAIIQVIP